jgi:hypothetical protein
MVVSTYLIKQFVQIVSYIILTRVLFSIVDTAKNLPQSTQRLLKNSKDLELLSPRSMLPKKKNLQIDSAFKDSQPSSGSSMDNHKNTLEEETNPLL